MLCLGAISHGRGRAFFVASGGQVHQMLGQVPGFQSADHATLAVIERDVASLDKRLAGIGGDITALRSELTRLLADLENRTRANEIRCAGCEPRLGTMREELNTLTGQSRVWGGVNSILAVVAGLVGFFKNP